MNKLLGVRDKLTIPVVAGDPKPFKLSINLMWLRGAIDGAKRSDGGERWYARVSIVDHISPVQLDNTNDCFSITLAVDLFRQKKHSIHEICSTLGITKPTLYPYVREAAARR